MSEPLQWKPIETAPKDAGEVIVGWDWASVWITRSAFYRDGKFWEMQGFDSQAEAAGWWSYKHSVTQEKVEPTHWLCVTPELPEEA